MLPLVEVALAVLESSGNGDEEARLCCKIISYSCKNRSRQHKSWKEDADVDGYDRSFLALLSSGNLEYRRSIGGLAGSQKQPVKELYNFHPLPSFIIYFQNLQRRGSVLRVDCDIKTNTSHRYEIVRALPVKTSF